MWVRDRRLQQCSHSRCNSETGERGDGRIGFGFKWCAQAIGLHSSVPVWLGVPVLAMIAAGTVRIFRLIRGSNSQVGSFHRKCKCNGPRTSTQIRCTSRIRSERSVSFIEGKVNKLLCLWSRNEHPRINHQIKAPEGPVPHLVLNRFAC